MRTVSVEGIIVISGYVVPEREGEGEREREGEGEGERERERERSKCLRGLYTHSCLPREDS